MHDLFPRGAEAVLTLLGAWLGLIWGSTLQSVAPLLWWYAIFVGADIFTGIWAAFAQADFQPKKLSFGMVKKALSFAIIILSHGLDVSFWYVLHDMPVFQSITLCAYALGEFGSIVANIERAGYGAALPPVLRRVFLTMEERFANLVDKKLDDVGLRDGKGRGGPDERDDQGR